MGIDRNLEGAEIAAEVQMVEWFGVFGVRRNFVETEYLVSLDCPLLPAVLCCAVLCLHGPPQAESSGMPIHEFWP